jgi:hypothetical protein
VRVAAALGLAVLVGVVGAGAVAGQAARGPRLSVTVAPGKLTVGDRAVVTLELAVPASELAGEVRFPTWAKTWGDAEIVSAGPVERSAGGPGETRLAQRVTLVAFLPGKVPLPAVDVVVPMAGGNRKLSTPPNLALDVSSVIPGDPKEASPKPPAAPRPLPWGGRFWWTFAAMSVLALALGSWVFARRRAAETAVPALPPFEELERELARISAALNGLGSVGASARIAAALSSALRRYLGRELEFPALESTTTEIQRRLRAGQTPEGISRPGVDLLRRLDRIKFSRRELERAERSDGATSGTIFPEAIAAALSVAIGLDRHLRPGLPESASETAVRAAGARGVGGAR